MTIVQEQTITTADGHALAARFFEPASAPKAAVLVVPAMGVSQRYYEAFSTWLAAQGFLVATFDYRGVGRSRPASLRGFSADIFDWARLDCAAMIDTLGERAPGVELLWVGHSLGGQIFPFVPNRARVARMVTVACGSGYWKENSLRLRLTVWWLWFVAVPLSIRLFGYYPGRRLRKVGDLPSGVIQQWRRWCLDPEYSVGVEHARDLYAAVTTPIVSLSFTDDEYMSARNIESLHGFYSNAPRTMKRLAPRDVGLARIGHFGFFRPQQELPLWQAHLLPALAPV